MHLVSLGRLTHIFIQYGYLAVFVGLLAEGAGIPLPGETLLLIASALAARRSGLNIGWVALVAFCTTSAGDNIGFCMGCSGGQALLDRFSRKLHVGPGSIQRGRDFISRHGALGSVLRTIHRGRTSAERSGCGFTPYELAALLPLRHPGSRLLGRPDLQVSATSLETDCIGLFISWVAPA